MSPHSSLEAALTDASPALLGYFLRRVDPAEDAADLVSETMAAAWRVEKRMPTEPDTARMWLFGVARHVLRNHERGTRRRDALAERLRLAIATAPPPPETEATAEIRAAVRALPIHLAELIRLVHWDGFSIEEASVHLGISASAARTRHQRAKELLREALAGVPR